MYCYFIWFLVLLCVFFFSSRRRHTRCSRDWSSDVCSSDLPTTRRARREHRVVGRRAVDLHQIGRASCRERVEISVGAVSLKKKTKRRQRAVVVALVGRRLFCVCAVLVASA